MLVDLGLPSFVVFAPFGFSDRAAQLVLARSRLESLEFCDASLGALRTFTDAQKPQTGSRNYSSDQRSAILILDHAHRLEKSRGRPFVVWDISCRYSLGVMPVSRLNAR
ncbi:MAG: hypothetical protein NDJ92_02200 [Thermoanaerobaculia bacterium]|nr:hypothetical protein [Thermoanaerobaculia bacterium]